MTEEDKAWEQFSKADGMNVGDASAVGMLQAIMAELNSVKADTARLAQKIDGEAAPPAEGMGEVPGEMPPAGDMGAMPPADMGGAPAEAPMEAPPEMPPANAPMELTPQDMMPPVPPAMPAEGADDQTLLALQDALTQVTDPEAIAKLADLIKEYVEKTYSGAGDVPEEVIAEVLEGAAGEPPMEAPMVDSEEPPLDLLDALMKSDPAEKDEDSSFEKALPEEGAGAQDAGAAPAAEAPAAEASAEPAGQAGGETQELKASEDEGEVEVEDPVIQINLFLGKDIDSVLKENEDMGTTEKDKLPTQEFKVCDPSDPTTKSYRKSFNELFNEKAREMYGDDGRKNKVPVSKREREVAEITSIRKSLSSFDSVGKMRVGDVLTTMKGLFTRGARDLEKTYEPLIDEMVKNLDNTVGPQYTIPLFRSFDIDLGKIYEPLDTETFERKSFFAGKDLTGEADPKGYGKRFDAIDQFLRGPTFQNREDVGARTGSFTSYDDMVSKRKDPAIQKEVDAAIKANTGLTEDEIRNAIAIRNFLNADTSRIPPADLIPYFSKWDKFFAGQGGFFTPESTTTYSDNPLVQAANFAALRANTARALKNEGITRDPTKLAILDMPWTGLKSLNNNVATPDLLTLAALAYDARNKGDAAPIAGLNGLTEAELSKRLGLPSQLENKYNLDSIATAGKGLGMKSFVRLPDGRYLPHKAALTELKNINPGLASLIEPAYAPLTNEKSGEDVGGFFRDKKGAKGIGLREIAGDPKNAQYLKDIQGLFGADYGGYQLPSGFVNEDGSVYGYDSQNPDDSLFLLPGMVGNNTTKTILRPEKLAAAQEYIHPVPDAVRGLNEMKQQAMKLGWKPDMGGTIDTSMASVEDSNEYNARYPVKDMIAQGLEPPTFTGKKKGGKEEAAAQEKKVNEGKNKPVGEVSTPGAGPGGGPGGRRGSKS